MIMEILFFSLVLIALIIGSVTDLKTREVPDQLNYFLIVSGLGLRTVLAIIYSDPFVIIAGLIGFASMFALAMFLFYTGQWGGGDAKLLMGLGAMIGMELSFTTFLVSFIINLIVVGAIFGLIYSIFLAYKHKTTFIKNWKNYPVRRFERYVVLAGLFPLLVGFFIPYALPLFALLTLLIIGSYYVLIFMKVVEHVCMIKKIPISKLTEGDWIVEDVVVGGEHICGPSDLGITDKQIERLKQLKIKEITIKEGMPFVPSFLVAYIITFYTGPWFVTLISGALS
jgi:prepilin peptidase CpaA